MWVRVHVVTSRFVLRRSMELLLLRKPWSVVGVIVEASYRLRAVLCEAMSSSSLQIRNVFPVMNL